MLYFPWAKYFGFYGSPIRKEIYTLCSFLFVLNLLNGPVDLNFLQASKQYSEVRIYGF